MRNLITLWKTEKGGEFMVPRVQRAESNIDSWHMYENSENSIRQVLDLLSCRYD